jgi:NhaA family Na+:H+ antiporter
VSVYASSYCRSAHTVVSRLRDQFGERLTYVYRHLLLADRALATKAAELAEYAPLTQDRFGSQPPHWRSLRPRKRDTS